MNYLTALLYLFTTSFLQAQSIGARSAGLAHASSTFGDTFSVIHNPGSLGIIETGDLATGYSNHYNVEGWNSVYVAFNTNISGGFLGTAISRFGDELMNLTTVHVGFGHKLGLAALGGAVVYNQLFIEGFGIRKFVQLDIGGIADLSTTFSLSAGIINITQSRLSNKTDEFYPTLFYLGFRYSPTTYLNVVGQIDKSLDFNATYKSGIEYQINSLILRVGVSTNPAMVTAGLGLVLKKLNLDYAFANNSELGSSQSFGINYSFVK